VKKIILSEHFLKHCTNFGDLVAPIVYGLRDLDAKIPCMGKVLHIVKEFQKHVFTLQRKHFLFGLAPSHPTQIVALHMMENSGDRSTLYKSSFKPLSSIRYRTSRQSKCNRCMQACSNENM